MKNKQETVVGLIVIVILVGGYYLYHSQQQKSDCLSRIVFEKDADVYNITHIGKDGIQSEDFKTQADALQWCKAELFK